MVERNRVPTVVEIDSSRDRDRLATVILSGLWAVPLVVIGIHGEFPLNDDWAYARTTQTLLETGRFARDAWTFAPILTNVGLGVVFSWVFGFSFEALRLSGVFMGWLGLVGAYRLFREVGVDTRRSFFGAAVVGFNPIHLNLSYTFMTDVPFTALCTWSLVFCARGLLRSSWRAMAAGMALCALAALSRQPGVAIVPAAVLAASVAPEGEFRTRMLLWGGVAVVGAVGGLAILFAVGGPFPFRLPEFVRGSAGGPSLAGAVVRYAVVIFVNLGLFLSPVVALMLSNGAGLQRRVVAWTTGLSVLVLLALLLSGESLPIGGNVLYDLGVGPSTVHGARFLPGAPDGSWWLATAVAAVAGSFAVALLGMDVVRHRFRSRPDRLLLLVFPLLYLAPLLGVDNFFDRYLLPILAPLAAVLLGVHAVPSRARVGGVAAALGLLAALAMLGVLGTRDYLEHSRARWSLLQTLIERGVPAERIDGGFEFDGWSGLHPATVWEQRRRGKSYEFVVSHLGPRHMRDFRVLDTRWYQRLLPPRKEGLVLYQRVGSKEATR